MQSIYENISNTIVIQKSKFICDLISVQNIEDIKKHLEQIKQKYPDATHYCYAYICGNLSRCSDDGEPSGTAGMPILNVLKKRNLDYILCIVTRYFGGIKLGAGGLVRAYSNAVTEALNQSKIITLIPGKLISYTFPYSNEKQIEYVFKDATIIEKKYKEDITYIIEMSNDIYEHLKDTLSLHIIKDVFVKK